MAPRTKPLEKEEEIAMLVDQAVAKAIERAGVNPTNLTINITINYVSGGGATMHVRQDR